MRSAALARDTHWLTGATQVLSAKSRDELLSQLSGSAFTVPPRSQGRTKEHVERFTVARLLASLPPDRLRFPLSVVHKDKPDFRLTIEHEVIGIEHTEAIASNDAHAQSLRERGHGPNVYFIRHSTLDEPRKSATELIEEIEAAQPSEPWIGDSAEREWAASMIHRVEKKAAAYRKADFEKFSQNWLIIYDNLSLPHVDPEKSASFLAGILSTRNSFEEFDHIFVLNDQTLWEFRDSFCVVHQLVKPT